MEKRFYWNFDTDHSLLWETPGVKDIRWIAGRVTLSSKANRRPPRHGNCTGKSYRWCLTSQALYGKGTNPSKWKKKHDGFFLDPLLRGDTFTCKNGLSLKAEWNYGTLRAIRLLTAPTRSIKPPQCSPIRAWPLHVSSFHCSKIMKDLNRKRYSFTSYWSSCDGFFFTTKHDTFSFKL